MPKGGNLIPSTKSLNDGLMSMEVGKDVAKSIVPTDPYAFVAQCVWGGVGLILLSYGKKRSELVPALGGIAIVFTSYMIDDSSVNMSLACGAILVAMYFMSRDG